MLDYATNIYLIPGGRYTCQNHVDLVSSSNPNFEIKVQPQLDYSADCTKGIESLQQTQVFNPYIFTT